ncbi:MAG: hypothetical protein WC421_08340 [Elusimicrobiales bacterium]
MKAGLLTAVAAFACAGLACSAEISSPGNGPSPLPQVPASASAGTGQAAEAVSALHRADGQSSIKTAFFGGPSLYSDLAGLFDAGTCPSWADISGWHSGRYVGYDEPNTQYTSMFIASSGSTPLLPPSGITNNDGPNFYFRAWGIKDAETNYGMFDNPSPKTIAFLRDSSNADAAGTVPLSFSVQGASSYGREQYTIRKNGNYVMAKITEEGATPAYLYKVKDVTPAGKPRPGPFAIISWTDKANDICGRAYKIGELDGMDLRAAFIFVREKDKLSKAVALYNCAGGISAWRYLEPGKETTVTIGNQETAVTPGKAGIVFKRAGKTVLENEYAAEADELWKSYAASFCQPMPASGKCLVPQAVYDGHGWQWGFLAFGKAAAAPADFITVMSAYGEGGVICKNAAYGDLSRLAFESYSGKPRWSVRKAEADELGQSAGR